MKLYSKNNDLRTIAIANKKDEGMRITIATCIENTEKQK